MRASLPKLAATIALSAASFAVADAYAACLLSIPGQPASNLAAALELAQLYLGHLPELPDAIAGFSPGAHRQQVVLRRNGITFVDDSKATNPAAVFAANRRLKIIVVTTLVRNALKSADYQAWLSEATQDASLEKKPFGMRFVSK